MIGEEKMSQRTLVNDLWEEFGRRAPKAAFTIHPSMVYSLRGQKESWRKTLREMEYVTRYFVSEITECKREFDDLSESGERKPFSTGMWIGRAQVLLEECLAENDLLLGYFERLERQISDALQASQSDSDR